MNSNKSPLDLWLADISHESSEQDDTWDPGFDGSRQVVISKLGLYRSLFQRSPGFLPRFFHQIYPLPIEDWEINKQDVLYGGFCLLNTTVAIHFQASIKYATAHIEHLTRINQHIKTSYTGLIKDVIDQELRRLNDGEWVETGLASVEKRIQTQINETLITQHVQCRALCNIEPTFEEIDLAKLDGRFAREDIYLKVLKKNFEFKEKQNLELLRQERELELRRQEHHQLMLEQRNQEEQLKLKEQALTSESARRLLEKQGEQLSEQFKVEERLHLERVKHQNRLLEIEDEIKRETQKDQLAKQLDTEVELQQEKLKHQKILKDQELTAELNEYQEQQALWNETKERMQLEKIKQEQRLKQLETEAQLNLKEQQQLEEQILQEKLYQEKLQHESRLKQMELDKQVEEQKKRYEATQQTGEYLRRDIELLILEKQRAELLQTVMKSKAENSPAKQLPPAAE